MHKQQKDVKKYDKKLGKNKSNLYSSIFTQKSFYYHEKIEYLLSDTLIRTTLEVLSGDGNCSSDVFSGLSTLGPQDSGGRQMFIKCVIGMILSCATFAWIRKKILLQYSTQYNYRHTNKSIALY